MNRKILSILCFLLAGSASYAQKSKVKAAANYLKEEYHQYDKAKEAIDAAVADESTKQSAEAWYYRGRIYFELYKDDKFGNLCNNCLQTSYESYQKSLELEPKGEHALEIKALLLPRLAQVVLNEGAEQYNRKEYAQAQASFESVMAMVPEDTTALKYAAIAAQSAGNKEKAKAYYEKLVGMGVKDPDFFISLSNYYRQDNDNSKALEVLRKGRTIYPDTLSLMYNEINVLLAMNNSREASTVIETALAKDPGNESLYLVLGNNYDKLANPKDDAGNDLPKPPNSDEMMKLAEDVYKRGLAVNPNSYGLNFNLGALYFNKAAELTNAANQAKEGESEKLRARSVDQFHVAQPYLEKAMAANPKANEDDVAVYQSTLSSLRELYARTNQMELYNKVNELIK